ncbi:MAG TPA: TonB-dependent receptor [Burkholderiales bacterium]|nr:TonB-dependent receptor [Burkholderiales bacterium]
MLRAVAGLLFSSVIAVSWAQDDAVVITATRFADAKRDLPVGVTLITADDLRKSATSNLPEVLAQFGLLHVRDAGGTPNQQVDLRGFGATADQNTLILVDGTRISENDQSAAQLTAIPLEAIERIEIVRGSGAVLYGGGAVGGTVNIITRPLAPGSARAHALGRFGGYGTHELRAGLARAGEALGLGLDVSHEDTEGYREHNQFRQTNVAAKLQASGERGRAHLRVAAGEQAVELPGALTEAQIAADPRQAGTVLGEAERTDGTVALGGALHAGRHELAADLAYREKHASTRFTTPFAFLIDTRVRQWALTPRAKLRFEAFGRTHDATVGVDLEEWHYGNGARRGDHGNRAAYALANLWLADRTRLVVGAREHRSDQTLDGRNAKHSLEAHELAVRQGLGAGWSVYAKRGTSFRVANFDDILFTATPLEPQTARAGELGLELERGGLRGRLAAYDMRLENEIAFSPAAGPFGANVNLEPTRRRGLELEAAWRALRSLELRAGVGLLQAQFRDGREVPLVPEAIATAGASWSVSERTRLNVHARHVGRQRYDNDQANRFRRQPAYGLVDVKLEHRIARANLALEVRNLLDEKYYSYGIRVPPGFSAYPQPQRAVYLSVAYRLD